MKKNVKFRVLGKNINYEDAVKLTIPRGWELVEFKDVEEIVNNAEKYNIERVEYYFFKQFVKNNSDKLSVLWLGWLGNSSCIDGNFHDLDCNYRARGVLIKKVK